jgi:hypothetical protein
MAQHQRKAAALPEAQAAVWHLARLGGIPLCTTLA